MKIGLVVARGCFATLALLMVSLATAVAQSGKLPDPADPGASAPATKYESAFSDYQPFRAQARDSWKQLNKEVADSPGMGSMSGMPSEIMSDMDSKTAEPPMSKEGAGGHAMDSMKDMPDKPMPGMDKKAATVPKSKRGAGGHDMESMKDMPSKTMPGTDSKTADAPMSKKDHGEVAMAKPNSAPGQAANAQTAGITGTGVVQGIDKANGKIKLTHDPIAALGWPKMTMFFRLKDSALADQVKEGDKVEFSLEKSASGYVITGFQKGAARHDMKPMK